jgi:hypothetical protein
LAALHHPDKLSGADSAESSAFFIHLKVASDTLHDAAKRFAYERFGPVMISWDKCVTIKDFVTRGVLYNILPYYAVAAVSIYCFGLLGYMDFAKFYRWLILLALCLFEVQMATRNEFPPLLRALNGVLTRFTNEPPYLPFEFVHLARKITMTVYIALSQIGPQLAAMLKGGATPQKEVQDNEAALRDGLARLQNMSRLLDSDATRLLDMELTPFKGDPEAATNLRGKMREWLVQNTIRADPMVRDALGTSFRKRRVDAPSGARGNR